jgi:hypothetical protein
VREREKATEIEGASLSLIIQAKIYEAVGYVYTRLCKSQPCCIFAEFLW